MHHDIILCAGCSDNDRFGLGDNEEASVASSIVLSEADARQIADKSPIRLYFANEDNSKLKLEIRYIPVSETTKSVNHLAEIIGQRIDQRSQSCRIKAYNTGRYQTTLSDKD